LNSKKKGEKNGHQQKTRFSTKKKCWYDVQKFSSLRPISVRGQIQISNIPGSFNFQMPTSKIGCSSVGRASQNLSSEEQKMKIRIMMNRKKRQTMHTSSKHFCPKEEPTIEETKTPHQQ
jgi:hypothetical protein